MKNLKRSLVPLLSVLITLSVQSQGFAQKSKVEKAEKTEKTQANEFNWAGVPAYVDVNTRISSLEKEIVNAVGEERLTEDQSRELKKTLDRVVELNKEFTTDGKLTIWERVRLILDLDKLSQDLELRLAKRKTAITNLSGKQDQLEKEIAENYLSGRLTNSQAALYKSKLQEIQEKEKSYRKDNKLSQSEMLSISYDLDQLNLDLEKNLRVRSIAGPSIESRLTRLKNRKNNLVKQKKLTSEQESQINADITKIEKDYAAYKISDKKFMPTEVLELALELDKVGAKLNRYSPAAVSSAAQNIDNLQSELRTMMDEGKSKHTISLAQLELLKQEYNRIETLESLFKADNNFADSEILTVVRELETLKQRMLATSTTKAKDPNLKANIDALRKRVKEVAAVGRLKAGMNASEFDKNLDAIEKKLKQYNEDDSLSDSEILVVQGEIDSLNSKLESSLQNLPDMKERKLEIERRLNEALAGNRVAMKKAEELRREGSRISYMETMLKRDGLLSDEDIVKLSAEYDNLEKKLAALLPPLPDIEKLQAQVSNKIEEAKAKGNIPQAKLDYFSGEMERITSVGSSFKASDDRLSDWEIMALKADLEKLEKDIDKLSKPDQVKKQ